MKHIYLYFCIIMWMQTAQAQKVWHYQPYSIELEDSARQGIAEAQFKMGCYYYQKYRQYSNDKYGTYIFYVKDIHFIEYSYKYKSEAKNMFQCAASKGNTDAMNAMAFICEPDSIFYWIDKAAKLNNADAMYNLCQWYGASRGYYNSLTDDSWLGRFNYPNMEVFDEAHSKTKKKDGENLFKMSLSMGATDAYNEKAYLLYKSPTESTKYYQLSANQGNVFGLYELANAYYDGIGVTKETDKALGLWGKCSETGFRKAYSKLGDHYLAIGDSVKGLELLYKGGDIKILKSFARNNNAIAEYWLGRYHEDECIKAIYTKTSTRDKETGIELTAGEHREKAEAWFLKSARQNYAPAMGKLGYCYYFFHNSQDYHKASIDWIRKGSEANDPYSLYLLGLFYNEGWGIEKSPEKGYTFYKKAAENGHPDGQYMTGWNYYAGLTTTKNYTEASKWFEKSISNGSDYSDLSCRYLGLINEEEGKDAKAFAWFYLGANKKDPYCIFWYALQSWNQKNNDNSKKEKGLRLFSVADSLGNSNAPYYLGEYYLNELKDEKRGLQYIKSASDRGLQYATWKLASIYESRDDSKAFGLAKKLSDDNYADGMLILSHCYAFGIGTEIDNKKAEYWLRKSKEHGSKKASELINSANSSTKISTILR